MSHTHRLEPTRGGPVHSAVFLATILTATASAGDWYVDDDNCPGPGDGSQGNPFCLIQDAIGAATGGDRVLVLPGTYVENIDFLGKEITVRSDADGDPTTPDLAPDTTTINKGNDRDTPVVSFVSSEGPDSSIEGFTIVWGNAAPAGPQIYGSPTLTYCDIEGGWQGKGNIDADPLFLDPIAMDFSLQSGSPCIDAGDLSLAPTGEDLADNPRFLDGDLDRVMVVDMGAYEFGNVHLEITGELIPGGTLALDTTGTSQLLALLFFSTQSGEQLLYPYGALLVGAPLQFFPFAVIPDTRDITLPADAPVGMEIWVQELAVDLFSGAGNFSNPVKLVIE